MTPLADRAATMIDDWFEVIELPMSIEQFHALPINPAYKYEYFDDRAVLSPRPKTYSAVLTLTPRAVPEPVRVWGKERFSPRALKDEDWDAFPALFANAFWRVQPFAGLEDARRLEAARACLDKTRTGGDGPLIPKACAVMTSLDDDRPVAAALVTIQTGYDESTIGAPAPGGVLPHLTWIFVPPMLARHGLGSALLDAVVNALIDLNHGALASTFLLGNESSTLWHWRHEFRLLGYLDGPRRSRLLPRLPPRGDEGDPAGPPSVANEISRDDLRP